MSTRRVVTVAVGVVILLVIATLYSARKESPAPTSPLIRQPAATPARPLQPPPPPPPAPAADEVSSEPPSPIANDLNAPNGTIQQDLKILNELFVAWQTNFPHTGNPVGENNEITAALEGKNPLHYVFVPATNRAINARGELCDRWGTPFRFHQLSGTQMEIRSAGPDKKFNTPDDSEFAPWPKEN